MHPALTASHTLKMVARNVQRSEHAQKKKGLYPVEGKEMVWSPSSTVVVIGGEGGGKEGFGFKPVAKSEVKKVGGGGGGGGVEKVGGDGEGDKEQMEESKEKGREEVGSSGLEEELEEEEEVMVVEEENGEDSDSLVKLLYSEIAEGMTEDTAPQDEGKGGGVKQHHMGPQMLQNIHTVMVFENIQNRAKGTPPSKNTPPAEPGAGENSIILPTPDDETLRKAGEFRCETMRGCVCSYYTLGQCFAGEVINKLHSLTSGIKLDYYKFMDDYDQTFFYTAQQMEAGLPDYSPQTVLVRGWGWDGVGGWAGMWGKRRRGQGV